MRYLLDFGSVNAGGAPAFTVFARLDTLAPLTPPPLIEQGSGLYYFDYDWTASPAASISYKATLNSVELSDVISGTTSPGVLQASASVGSVAGFTTAKDVINRTAVQCGLAPMDDPFASQDVNYLQLVEYLNTLGDSLNGDLTWAHFIRECVFTTAGSATSYAMPADFYKMVPESGWNRSQRLPLLGPISSQEAQTIKAQLTGLVLNVPYRLQGNLMTFPLAPPNGTTIAFEYLSQFWVQSAGSSTGPDQDRCFASTDIVLYDPLLMVRGLKLQWLQAKGFDTTVAEREFARQREQAITNNKTARTLRMGGGRIVDRYLDRPGTPITGFGLGT